MGAVKGADLSNETPPFLPACRAWNPSINADWPSLQYHRWALPALQLLQLVQAIQLLAVHHLFATDEASNAPSSPAGSRRPLF
jgi:hypothetical protein